MTNFLFRIEPFNWWNASHADNITHNLFNLVIHRVSFAAVSAHNNLKGGKTHDMIPEIKYYIKKINLLESQIFSQENTSFMLYKCPINESSGVSECEDTTCIAFFTIRMRLIDCDHMLSSRKIAVGIPYRCGRI